MSMVEHSIKLDGGKVTQGRREPDAIGKVLTWFQPVYTEAVTMALRHMSKPRGRRPDWHRRALDIRLADISNGDGGTRLHFLTPTFGEAAEEIFNQQVFPFYRRPSPEETGFEALGSIVADVVDERRDSDLFDEPLLQSLSRLRLAGSWGVSALTFEGGRLSEGVVVRKDVADKATKLRRSTPPSQRARVSGRMDMIRASDGGFTLELASGDSIFGVVSQEPDILNQYWNTEVTIEGVVHFRPSGRPLRIEAEGLAAAQEKDNFFSRLPKPSFSRLAVANRRESQSGTQGLKVAFGAWPGDETDEEILEALEEIS